MVSSVCVTAKPTIGIANASSSCRPIHGTRAPVIVRVRLRSADSDDGNPSAQAKEKAGGLGLNKHGKPAGLGDIMEKAAAIKMARVRRRRRRPPLLSSPLWTSTRPEASRPVPWPRPALTRA